MQPQDDLQAFVQAVGQAHVDGYQKQKARALAILDLMESDEHRETLAQQNPDLAKLFESHTKEERERRIEELATGLGVAHAIVEAFRRVGLLS